MTHVAKGVDKHGIMNVDVIISGDVPTLPPKAKIIVLPYIEDYIQTGPGKSYNRLIFLKTHARICFLPFIEFSD